MRLIVFVYHSTLGLGVRKRTEEDLRRVFRGRKRRRESDKRRIHPRRSALQQGSGFRVQGSGFRVQGSGFRV